VEKDKYVWEWYDDPSRRPPGRNPFSESDPLIRKTCQPPRENEAKGIVSKKTFSK
jgi:hypothetical protein